MATRIPYLDEIWNVTTGCGDDMASPGCTHCYARRMFGRNLWKCPTCKGRGFVWWLEDNWDPASGRETECSDCRGTGHQDFTPTFHADRLDQPLHWRKPRVVGVSFMGDLFHEAITDEQILSVFNVIRRDWNRSYLGETPHTFMVLTKRPGRMHDIALRARLDQSGARDIYLDEKASDHTGYPILGHHGATGLPNVWLGVTVCNQEEWGLNVPTLKATPAAHRWVSYEPALGPLVTNGGTVWPDLGGIDWVVLGGETGPGARPMLLEWALDVHAQCKAADVPFFYKQDGNFAKKRWPETPILGSRISEMRATHELPAVRP